MNDQKTPRISGKTAGSVPSTISEVAQMLGENRGELTPLQIRLIEKFIADAGGIENARSVIKALESLPDAA